MTQLSVIIPTYNRVDQLKKTVAGLAGQSLPGSEFEVIVVSDGSTDGTHEFLQSASHSVNVRWMVQQNQGPAAARNAGVQAAGSELLLFLDDDVVPDADLLRVHAACQAGAGPQHIVLGPMLTPADVTLSPWVAWEQALLERYYCQMAEGVFQPAARTFFTGNVSLKRALFDRCGGFDPSFRRAEDVEFAFRAERQGASFQFRPDAKGYHYALRSFASWLQTAYRYGVCDVIFTHEKGVDWLLPEKLKEYRWRHPLIRMLVPICLDRKALQSGITRFFKWVGVRSYPKNLGVSYASFSAIYNLNYYQGIADQLGGRRKFFSLLASCSKTA